MVGPRARLLGLLVASPLLGPAPDPPVGCDHPAFRVYDSFSSQCECSALGTCPSQPTLFPDPNATTALDITPRTRFQILGWYCALPGCNQSVRVLNPWPMINLPTTYPQPFGNWSGDQSQLVNGGVPQAGDLGRMLQTIESGLASWIPDRQWDGHAAIDFEAWSPSWDENVGARIRYQNYSIRLALQSNPRLSLDEAVKEAKQDWESAALRWMVAILDKLHDLRPRARFGYYGFPSDAYSSLTCAGPKAVGGCENLGTCRLVAPYRPEVRARNDRLAALWRASGVLYPSIYLTDCFTTAEHTAFINGTVAEALRCARTAAADSGSAPAVMPFQWSFFEGSYSANESERTRVGAGRVALPPSLMPLPFTVSQAAGAQAVVMWDCPAGFETPHTGPGGRVPNVTRGLIEGEIAQTVRRLVARGCPS